MWQSFRWAASAWLLAGAAVAAGAVQPAGTEPDLKGQSVPHAVQALARWAFTDGDAGGRPFAVVDKLGARLYVFTAAGHLAGSTPALLGQQRGDNTTPGVGDRVATGIPMAQRTTPAGRFASEPGRNLQGEAVVWVDYDAAVAVHRLRPAAAAERRPQRLASATPADNRITLGCIVVAGDFYDRVVAPLLGKHRGTVYVLPDSQDWREAFPNAAGL